MKRVIQDYESVDTNLKRWGSGVWKDDIKIVGCGFIDLDSNKEIWTTEINQITDIVNDAEMIINHNMMYDSSINMWLGVDLKDKMIVDTMNMAYFHHNLDNSGGRHKTSLQNLSQRYLGQYKTQDLLGKAVLDHGLYKVSTGGKRNLNPELKRNQSTATDYAYAHLDEVYKVAANVVSAYCIQDCNLTKQLAKKFWNDMSEEWMYILSNCNKQYLNMKKNGIWLDMRKMKDIRGMLLSASLNTEEEIWDLLKIKNGTMANLNQKSFLLPIFDKMGIKYPYTEPTKRFPEGQPSITAEWLAAQNDPFCNLLNKHKSYQTYLNNYCDSYIEYKEIYYPNQNPDFIQMHPSNNCLAAVTGRASTDNPNIRSIPNFDKDKLDLNKLDDNYIGYMLRSCIAPRPGYSFVEADYKQQEFRLFAEACALLDMPRLKDLYINNREIDFHQMVSDEVTHMGRGPTKAINFGLLYGKQEYALSLALGKSREETKEIMKHYNSMFPEMETYTKTMEYLGSTRGYITIDGRKLIPAQKKKVQNKWRPGQMKWQTYEWQLGNWQCQGRGSNQIKMVMSKLYELDITPYLEVYDALAFEIKDVDSDIQKLETIKNVMEYDNPFKCSVPMLVDICVGSSWGDAKSKAGDEAGKELYKRLEQMKEDKCHVKTS